MMQSKEGKVASSKALDVGLIVTEYIRPVNDQVPFAEVKLTAQHNVLANEQQHSMKFEPIYDTYLLEKVDSNTTPDLTNMCHKGGEIDQNAEKCQVSCQLLDLSFDNMTTKFSNQSLESENISLKNIVAQLQKDFSRMEAHYVNMELKYQNQALKDGQHGQILNETSNKTKIDREIKVLETINIELEHSVAKLLAENENKTLENANLKAQIQEKVFVNVALKDELRKLKGNRVDTKFAKPSILRKPVLQPPRNQSVVRQQNVFNSERPNFSKPWFASQVDVNNDLPKPVTPYYFPKVKEYVLVKPYHVIAPGLFRNSFKESYGSNDMAHNYFLRGFLLLVPCVTNIIFSMVKGIPLTSSFIGTRGCVFNEGLFGVFHASLSVVGTVTDFTRGSDLCYLVVFVEQDDLPSSVGLDFRARLDGGRMYSGHLEAMRLP
ncbi:hypothetical protein Tco_0532564 [Tanacetum coccineum]